MADKTRVDLKQAETENEALVSQGESYWRYAWRRFKRHRLALAAAIMLILLILGAIFSPWLSPYDYSRQNRSNMFAAPGLTIPDGQAAEEAVPRLVCQPLQERGRQEESPRQVQPLHLARLRQAGR